MEEDIRLNLVGITFNQIESGVYALVLEDQEMHRRLAIVIGYPEAQSIECHLQKVKIPRPLSHDLMASFLKELGAEVLRIDIHRLPSGPYAGKITLRSVFGGTHEIDARSSDAIALAIRVGAPIFTTKQLMEKEGYTPKQGKGTEAKVLPKKNDLSNLSETQLQDKLNASVAEENYEEAARIKQEIDRRKGNGLDC